MVKGTRQFCANVRCQRRELSVFMPPVKEDVNSGRVAAAQPLDAAGNARARINFHN